MEKEIKELNEKIEQLKKEFDEKKHKNLLLNQEIKEIKEKYTDSFEEMSKKKTDLIEANQEINDINESLKIKNDELNKENDKSNELNEKNESIENLILQFSSSRDEQTKNKIIKKMLVSKKKLHKEKLDNFYKTIALHLKEKIENVKEWISLEDRFNKIDNLSNNICRELAKYIKVHQEGKFQSDNNTSKDFLRVHFVGAIKVKMIDLRSILKSYR